MTSTSGIRVHDVVRRIRVSDATPDTCGIVYGAWGVWLWVKWPHAFQPVNVEAKKLEKV